MPGQQLHDHDLHGAATLRRWDNGRPWTVWDHQTIRLGQLPDHRWWITWTGAPSRRPPLAFADQHEALTAVDWITGHTDFDWTEVPPDWQPAGYGNAIPT